MSGLVKFASLARAAIVASAALVALSNVPGFAEDARTTRIEPRPVYGATVTYEQGVRVFRPLPSEQRVVVNPAGMAPLSFNSYETSALALIPSSVTAKRQSLRASLRRCRARAHASLSHHNRI